MFSRERKSVAWVEVGRIFACNSVLGFFRPVCGIAGCI